MSQHVLLVDDDEVLLEVLATVLDLDEFSTKEIEAHAGSQHDPEVARAWCELVEEAEHTGSSIIGTVRGTA